MISTGEHECPCDDCRKRFDTRHGRKVHAKVVHGISLARTVEYDCAHCGMHNEKPAQRMDTDAEMHFCDRACHSAFQKEHATRRADVVCVECGDEFSVQRSNSENRCFCTDECYKAWATGRSPETAVTTTMTTDP